MEVFMLDELADGPAPVARRKPRKPFPEATRWTGLF